jgi:hypothetical protein
VLREIVVRVEKDEIRLALHWQGGDHIELTVRKNRTGLHRWGSSPDIDDLICSLARHLPDRAIASLLNRPGKTTGRQNGWTQSRVCTFSNHRGIAVYQGANAPHTANIHCRKPRSALGMRPMTVLCMIRAGICRRRSFAREPHGWSGSAIWSVRTFSAAQSSPCNARYQLCQVNWRLPFDNIARSASRRRIGHTRKQARRDDRMSSGPSNR